MASIPIELGRDCGPAHGGAGRSRLPIVYSNGLQEKRRRHDDFGTQTEGYA